MQDDFVFRGFLEVFGGSRRERGKFQEIRLSQELKKAPAFKSCCLSHEIAKRVGIGRS